MLFLNLQKPMKREFTETKYITAVFSDEVTVILLWLIHVSQVLVNKETHFVVSKTVKYLSCPLVAFLILSVNVPRIFHSIWNSEARFFF